MLYTRRAPSLKDKILNKYEKEIEEEAKKLKKKEVVPKLKTKK